MTAVTRVLFTFLFTFCLLFGGQIGGQTDDPWPDLPVSLNGKLPDATATSLWNEGAENIIWHKCIRTSQRLRDSWDPRNFFNDPQVIQLCDAIFRGDVDEMEALIEDGVDVNAKGEGGMNPLYWAFHLNRDPRPFSCLMKHGADPNVIVDMSGRNEEQEVFPGYSVTNLAVRGIYNRHFKTVFENGGDPNLPNECPFESWQKPAFFELWAIAPDSEERLKLMIEKGADMNWAMPRGTTFLTANSWANEQCCGLALIALDLGGADHLATARAGEGGEYSGCYFRSIHLLAFAMEKADLDKVKHKKFYKLVERLEERGESLDEAKEDLRRWKKWKEEGRDDLIEQEYQNRIKEEKSKEPEE